jgi:hypothetical protein
VLGYLQSAVQHHRHNHHHGKESRTVLNATAIDPANTNAMNFPGVATHEFDTPLAPGSNNLQTISVAFPKAFDWHLADGDTPGRCR